MIERSRRHSENLHKNILTFRQYDVISEMMAYFPSKIGLTSCVWTWGPGTFYPRNRKKFLEKTGVIFLRYTYIRRSKNPRNIWSKLWKCQFLKLRNYRIFLYIFRNFSILSPNAEISASMFFKFLCLIENIHERFLILKDSTDYSRFSSIFERIFIAIPKVPSGPKTIYLWFLNKFKSTTFLS